MKVHEAVEIWLQVGVIKASYIGSGEWIWSCGTCRNLQIACEEFDMCPNEVVVITREEFEARWICDRVICQSHWLVVGDKQIAVESLN